MSTTYEIQLEIYTEDKVFSNHQQAMASVMNNILRPVFGEAISNPRIVNYDHLKEKSIVMIADIAVDSEALDLLTCTTKLDGVARLFCKVLRLSVDYTLAAKTYGNYSKRVYITDGYMKEKEVA